MSKEERNRNIARDYYFTPMTIAEIGKKYGLAGSNISEISNRYDFKELKNGESIDRKN